MLAQEMVKAKGELSVVLRDEFGEVKQELFVPNLVVTVGKNWIAGRMKDTGIPAQMSHMAIGSGTIDPAVGDTTLGTELGRVALVVAGGSVTANTVNYSATFPAGTGTGAVTEAGIFNAASAGTMLCRTEFAVVNKGANDSLSISWNCQII